MVLKEAILRDLRNAIAKGELKSGERITENAICSRFGVSQTPVTEVLKQLEREGLLKISPNVGARVVDFSAKDVSDIYDVLIVLEGAAARLACSQVSEEEINKLKECQFMIEKAASQKNLDLLFELNMQFHMMITEFTENAHLIGIRKNFDGLLIRFGRLATFIPHHLNVTLEEHPKIIDAITKRNAALGEYLAREHMEKGKAYMLAYLQDLQKGGENKKISKYLTTYHSEEQEGNSHDCAQSLTGSCK